MTYSTIAKVRAVQGLDDVSVFSDDTVTEGLEYADELIDNYTGTSFTYKPFAVTLDGSACHSLALPVLFPRTLTSVTVDGVTETTTGWALHDDGTVIRSTGSFGYTFPGRNVVISGTAGFSATPPLEIALAARTIAIAHILATENRVPDRAMAIQSEFGNIQLAQAGGLNRPTEYPTVNTALNRHRHRPPVCF